jgi:hypothetical protein
MPKFTFNLLILFPLFVQLAVQQQIRHFKTRARRCDTPSFTSIPSYINYQLAKLKDIENQTHNNSLNL